MTLEELKQHHLNLIGTNWINIKDIEDPCEEVQIAAIQKATLSIKYIKTPTLKAQMEAVQRNAGMIIHILSPYQEVIDHILKCQDLIMFKEIWDNSIKSIFKDNSIMVNKWLRYGNNIRSL
jgi:hypothetical protein